MAWQIDSWVKRRSYTVGTTSVKVLDQNPLRAGYRITSAFTNTSVIYHGYDAMVDANSPDYILPGGFLQDTGEWQTVHKGEVWLIASEASQQVTVEKVLTLQIPRGYQKLKWWQRRW